jgi:hypothetical protein
MPQEKSSFLKQRLGVDESSITVLLKEFRGQMVFATLGWHVRAGRDA